MADPIISLCLFAGLSALITILAIPLAQLLGRRMNAWDHPDELGIHPVSLTRSGGIAIAVGLFVGLQLVWSRRLDILENRLVAAAVIGGAAAFLVGLLDDLHEIKPSAKALGLAAAAIAAQLISPHGSLTGFQRLDFVLGVLVLFTGANSLNLFDGMDGLAAGTVFIACAGLAAASYIKGHQLLTAQAALVAGAALGFWFFNRPPAKIFMGDCGSLMLGFLLFAMGLRMSSYGLERLLSALSILSLPILDTALAIVRRLLARTDIFTGDRSHIYDIIYRRRKSVWQTLLIVYLAAFSFAGLGMAALFLKPLASSALLALSWAAVVIWMAAWGMFRKETVAGGFR